MEKQEKGLGVGHGPGGGGVGMWVGPAKEGPAGGLISTLVYDPDYYSNLGELHDVQREQRVKNCAPDTRPAKLLDKPQDNKKKR